MASYDAPEMVAEPGKARILVVDDSAITRAVIGRSLKTAGMRVDEARGGAEALEVLTTTGYDVVISDLCMPGMDGFTLLAAIKAQAPMTEVIILSGVSDVDRVMQTLKRGAHAFLPKPPAHPEQVLFTVRRALETKRLRERCADLQQQLDVSAHDGCLALPARRVPSAREVASQ